MVALHQLSAIIRLLYSLSSLYLRENVEKKQKKKKKKKKKKKTKKYRPSAVSPNSSKP